MEDLRQYVTGMARAAKKASASLRTLSAAAKNAALAAMAASIDERRTAISEANARDLAKGRKAGLSKPVLDRLALTEARIDALVASLKEIEAFEDPVGEVIGVRRPAGFTLEKVRTPIGVIAMIYESRPNVTVDAAALCLKSGNASILRGGSEAFESSSALVGRSARALQPRASMGTPCSTSSARTTRRSTFS
jgi:glutamate-5-semialdehyde dehydrogenase